MSLEKNAKRVLRALCKQYRSTGETSRRFDSLDELAKSCHIESHNIYDVVKFLEVEGLVTYKQTPLMIGKGPEDPVWHFIEITDKGIDECKRVTRPWYNKGLDPIRAIYVATVEGIARAFKDH